MFEQIPSSPVDPIFRVMAAYRADSRPNKVDLGIGVIRDDQGVTPVMAAVRKAEHWLAENLASKAYLGPAGRPGFCDAISTLLLPDHPATATRAIFQTPGGTAALRVAGDLISFTRPGSRIWLSDPPWVTHRAIFPAAGLQLASYRYLNPECCGVDFDAMLADLSRVQPGDTVLLQVAGHNPSGCDLTTAQWKQLAALMNARGALPLLDLAYHGLAHSLTEDRQPVAIIAEHCQEWLCCYSCSKTFGLYNDRTGALILQTGSKKLTERVSQETVNRICSNYYMPPDHGAAVIEVLLNSTELHTGWQQELAGSQRRLHEQRSSLADALSMQLHRPIPTLLHQSGLFSYLGLSDDQLTTLATDYAIYAGSGGRLNISGLNARNLAQVSAGLAAVMAKPAGTTSQGNGLTSPSPA